MASDGSSGIVEKNRLVNVRTLIERAVRLDESAMEDRLAGRVQNLELNPGLIHVPQFGWKGMRRPAVEHDNLGRHFLTRFELY